MVQKKAFWVVLAVTLSIALTVIAVSAAKEDLVGTYKLVSDTRKVLDTGEVLYPYGKNPVGYIMYGKEGRMLVLVVGDDRPRPASIQKAMPEQQAALFRSMLAYGGTYKFDGTRIEHHIDISWNELWTGMTVIREVRKEGDKLIYTTNPAPFPGDGKMGVATLIWEKIK
jgi:hypothetical protein